jgi:hypothetical protein
LPTKSSSQEIRTSGFMHNRIFKATAEITRLFIGKADGQ